MNDYTGTVKKAYRRGNTVWVHLIDNQIFTISLNSIQLAKDTSHSIRSIKGKLNQFNLKGLYGR